MKETIEILRELEKNMISCFTGKKSFSVIKALQITIMSALCGDPSEDNSFTKDSYIEDFEIMMSVFSEMHKTILNDEELWNKKGRK